MKIASSRGLLILVSFSLIISIFAPMGMIGDVQASGPTYTEHPTIHIASNSDLVTLKASGGCTGSGTIDDPYVIDGYDISGTGFGTGGACIYVADITVRLVISNNYLHGNDYGVRLIRSNHVLITNNNCSGNDRFGIFLDYTGNDTLTNNICIVGAHGIYAYASGDNIMKNNLCRATRACAVMLAGSSNRNVFSNNTCYSSGDNGVYVLQSDHNTISNNTLKNNIGHGIHLADADHNDVYGNEIIGNNGSSSIYNSLHPQSVDTGVGNHWDNGSSGNYWSDWTTPDDNSDGIVDNPYLIGEGSSKDNYPLVNINIPGTTVPGVPTGLIATAGNGQVGLTWSAPSSNGGAAIDYYIVYQDGAALPSHLTGLTTVISGLTNGHNYSFKVAAHNTAGIGAKSAGTSSIPYTVSNTPTGLTILPGDAQAALNWTVPSFNGGAAIDYYIVYQDGADVVHVTSIFTTISGLTNGRSYSFAVAAHNVAGIGAQTSAVATTPTASITVPGVPTGLTAIAEDGQVALNWTVPSFNGGAAIDYYIVYQDGAALPSHLTGLTTVISGLINGQTYSFTVSAHNLAGSGAESTAVTVTSFPAPTVPAAPTDLVATPGNTQVSLAWTAPTNDGSAAIDYYIVYQDGIDVSHPTMGSKTITGLINGQSYTFTVAAYNSVGTGAQTSGVSATPNAPTPITAVPDAPTGLTSTPGNAQVSLSWSTPGSDGGATIDYYVVYQNGTDVQHPTGTSVTITGLANGQTYGFIVAAHNSAGVGVQSTEVLTTPSQPTTVPGIPTGLTAMPGNTQISLSWTVPSDNGGVTIDYYIVYQDGIDVSHPTSASKTINVLANGDSYSFTVAAHNSVGIGPQTSAVVAVPSSGTGLPGTPTDLTTTQGDGLVTLSWSAPVGGSGIDYYVVYQNGIEVGHPTGTSTTITGLTNGQNYTFTVSAHNSDGVGAPSSSQIISPIASSNPGSDNMVIFAGIIALLAFATIAVVLVSRRKQKKE